MRPEPRLQEIICYGISRNWRIFLDTFEKLIDDNECLGLGESPPLKDESILCAQLASMASAIEQKHIKRATAVHFCTNLQEKWNERFEEGQRKGKNVYVTRIQRDFTELVKSYFTIYCFADGRADGGKQAQSPECEFVTVQPHHRLVKWLRNEVLSEDDRIWFESEDLEYSDFLEIVNLTDNPGNFHEDARVGYVNAWVSPFDGDIQNLINVANSKNTPRDKSTITQIIRNRLGLWHTKDAFCVAFTCSSNAIDQSKNAGRNLCAPTVFDARGYERFRHWPLHLENIPIDPSAGRTYELDPSVRANKLDRDGAPEFVTDPLPIGMLSSKVTLGWCGPPPGHDDIQKCHQTFALDVAGTDSLKLASRRLDAALGDV